MMYHLAADLLQPFFLLYLLTALLLLNLWRSAERTDGACWP